MQDRDGGMQAKISVKSALVNGPRTGFHSSAKRRMDLSDSKGCTTASSCHAVGAGWWGESTSLHLARQDFQALLISSGPLTDRILAVGGCCKGVGSLSSTEIFNPADGSWTSAGPAPSPSHSEYVHGDYPGSGTINAAQTVAGLECN